MKHIFEYITYNDDIPVRSFVVSIDSCPPHWHEEIEIIYVLNGDITVSSPERIYKMKKNDILVVNSKEVHQFQYSNTENKVLVVQIHPGIIEKRFHALMRSKIECFSPDYDSQFDKAFSKIRELSSSIMNEFASRQDGYKYFVFSHVNTIFAYIFRYFTKGMMDEEEYKIKDTNLKRLNDIFGIVKEKYMYDINLKDIADSMHLNYYYISHFFKKQTGMQFSRYLNEIRLEKAKELLQESNLKIIDVAMESGFKTDKKVYDIFRRTFGLTPMQYKKSKIKDKKSKNEKDYTFGKYYNESESENEIERRQEAIIDSAVSSFKNTGVYKAFNKYIINGDVIMAENKTGFIIKADVNDPVRGFGVSELRHFLEAFGNKYLEGSNGIGESCWVFELSLDKSLKNKSFSISCSPDEASGSTKVSLKGEDSSCILNAVHTFLEKAGILFEITGPVMPSKLSLEKTCGWSEVVTPAVMYRGIRQHINFPMDISSYTLEEAKEYIRNAARMRFNHITFHSYTGQWYRAELPGRKITAGWFFYGQIHEIPEVPLLKAHIRNEKIYCIPEIEQVFGDREKRSEAAINWLQQVMGEAKRVGLNIQFSIENWNSDKEQMETVENMVLICDSIIKDYPLIDTLEIISRECVSCEDMFVKEDPLTLLLELLGDERDKNEKLIRFIKDTVTCIPGTAIDVAANIKLAHALKKHWQGRSAPGLSIGIYEGNKDAIRLAYEMMCSCLPEDVNFAFLVGHGAHNTYEAMASVPFSRETKARTMFYSWSEFDGLMYLMQNFVEGNLELVSHLQRKTPGRIHGYAVNHWRTSENKTTLRYISELTLNGFITPGEFYRSYAKAYGIKPPNDFIKAMMLLDLAETDVRKMSNVAFSFVGCWVDEKLGYISIWDKKHIPPADRGYDAIIYHLRTCLDMTEDINGKEHIEFLLNRVECSKIYLRAIDELMNVKDIAGNRKKEELNESERENIRAICDRALKYAGEYMEHHVRKMPDRGCEGTLISYYHTLPAYIKRIKYMYGEGKATQLCKFISPDAPPSPDPYK